MERQVEVDAVVGKGVVHRCVSEKQRRDLGGLANSSLDCTHLRGSS